MQAAGYTADPKLRIRRRKSSEAQCKHEALKSPHARRRFATQPDTIPESKLVRSLYRRLDGPGNPSGRAYGASRPASCFRSTQRCRHTDLC